MEAIVWGQRDDKSHDRDTVQMSLAVAERLHQEFEGHENQY